MKFVIVDPSREGYTFVRGALLTAGLPNISPASELVVHYCGTADMALRFNTRAGAQALLDGFREVDPDAIATLQIVQVK